MSRSIYLLILAIAFLIAIIIDTSYFNVIGAIILLSIGMILPILFVFYKETNSYMARIYFRPIHIFLLSFVIVFFQAPVDILLGYQYEYYRVGRIDLMPETVKLALLGMIAFLIGYIIKKDNNIISEKNNTVRFLYAPTTIFKLLTSIMLVAIFVVIPKSILFGGYTNIGDSGYNYLSSWCNVFFCAFFIQYSINQRLNGRGRGWSIIQFLKDIGWWQNLNMLIYILLILNLGDRGPLLYVIFIYYIVYVITAGICPSKKTIIVGGIIGIFFVAFLGYTKKYRDHNSIFERINTTWQANPYMDRQESVVPTTYELSTSYRCLSYSVEDVQKNGNYGYGKYQLSYILSCIPFAGGLLGLPDPTSTYISHLIQGTYLTYGNGTSVIADFYLDVGVIGMIICMFIFGYFTRTFELVLFSNKKASLLLYCIAFYFSIHFVSVPRSFLLIDLKYSVWLALILYVSQHRSISSIRRK